MDVLSRISSAAAGMCLGLTDHELLVLSIALTRLESDGEDEESVVRWAQHELGLTPDAEVRRLAASGVSIRQIAALSGVSKSRVQRLVAGGVDTPAAA